MKRIHVDLFDVILSDISLFKTDFPNVDYVICGDMNERTGTLPDYIVNDYSSYLPLPDEYVEDVEPIAMRHNEDKMINTQGKRVIEICKMCNLRIANGRIGADSHRGRIKCVTYNGQSDVDYVICINFICFIVIDTTLFLLGYTPYCFVDSGKWSSQPTRKS